VTWLTETHKISDVIGTLAFGVASVATLHQAQNYSATQVLLTCCVTLWSLRLASYLFYRILTIGEDHRLHMFYPDRSKGETWWKSNHSRVPKIFRLIGFWIFQTLWCIIGLLPIYMAQFRDVDGFTKSGNWFDYFKQINTTSWIGFAAFTFFFLMETIADFHKFSLKTSEHAEEFVHTGLYHYSQHPNYFAEIGIWWSLWMACFPLLPIHHWWTIISPLFMWIAITRVSGIPPLEYQWHKKYGHLPKFQEWRRNTNKLIPWFPRKE